MFSYYYPEVVLKLKKDLIPFTYFHSDLDLARKAQQASLGAHPTYS